MPGIVNRKVSGLVACGVVLACHPVASLATEPIDHLNVRPRPLPNMIPSSQPGVAADLAAPRPAPPPDGERENRRMLRRIEFHGNATIAAEELRRVAAPWLDHVAGSLELEQLRSELTRHYVSLGFVNSGALIKSPVQDDGSVVIEIVEGKVSMVRIRGLDGLAPGYVGSRLFPEPEAPLNLNVLRERFQLLLDDPLISRMNARLSPGSAAGDAHLDIDVERSPTYGITVFANNHRPASIGEQAAGVAGFVRNLTGHGDVLEGTIQNPVRGENGQRADLGWKLPLGGHGTALSVQFGEGQSSIVEEPLKPAGISSRLQSSEIGLSQTLAESLRQRLVAGASLLSRENRTTLLGQPFSFVPGELNGITRASTTRAWIEYVRRNDIEVLALRATLSATQNNLREAAGLPAPSPQPASSASFWLGQAQYMRRITDDGLQLLVRATVQEASRRLLALDGISVGGSATVRGYRENQLVRDRGHIINLELDVPVIRESASAPALNLIPFIDHGAAQNIGEAASTMSSLGLALRMRWGAFAMDIAAAARAGQTGDVRLARGSIQDGGMHFQVSYRLTGR